MVDKNYLVIGSHIDLSLHDKIKRGDYVDFAKLLPKDKIATAQEEHCFELVNRGGQTFFVPAERESGVTSFQKWEQAFRIFSNIYTQEHLDRASELIQYNHVIFTAASTYQWSNVYTHDSEFRTHLSYYPERSWAIILQQAWSMHLKDQINYSQNKFGNGNGHTNSKKEACKCFNKGLCTAGRGCRYDHHCLECGKFGHGAHMCRRKSSNSNLGGSANGSSGERDGAAISALQK